MRLSARSVRPVLLLSLLMVGVTTPIAGAAETNHRGGPEVIAHRGSSGVAPENTVAAITTAREHRADSVEVDVQRTADGELVLFHDCTLERTTNVEEVFPDRESRVLSDYTADELAQLDAGSWLSPEFAGEPIPTLREGIRALGVRTDLLLEVKVCEGEEGLGEAVADGLREIPGYLPRALALDSLVVQSFDHEQTREFHDELPRVPVGLLFGARPTDAELADAATWAQQANPRYTLVDQELVDQVHSLGLDINVWTVNEEADMTAAVDLGVDGVITDYPQVLRELLRTS
ncbi:glycerophosphodiester phosphodiesterase [Actinoalloteichus hymeniacidonis]|uniref:Glycerophosphoryl diester phosphodiesterase n=1 Tax=Actinoalloteichus hymeniacidonis TaxID=340345 RepID=A0AAC9HT14_9PSEU|nr:glycerophosphodiester phosphodiesterase family protein [Actinoalloteichus hymeniacidonis]AOS65107.1 glycerophosphoryl diester phosphodiesterase [Actinoalloteichus hymeniacidonis]MBB5906814.1 glycerophosphoryl diester phosphodiesterase [Actinoalloteichus hymeniacidonis]